MAEPAHDTTHDDAPLTTSKSGLAPATARDSLVDPTGTVLVGRSVTINRPRAELFALWRDFANFAQFMENVESGIGLELARLAAQAGHGFPDGRGGLCA